MQQSFLKTHKMNKEMSISTDKYRGVIVPMVSPVDNAGNIDAPSAGRMIDFLLNNQAIPFIMGTTGEASSINLKNREKFVRVLVQHKRDGIPVIAGVIGNSFSETVSMANGYFKMGADAAVLTLPNYYPLNDNEIYHYFKSASERMEGDIILYNIPKTIHMSIPVEVIERLSAEKNIIGVKDSEYNNNRLEKSLALWRDRTDFFHLVGVNKLMVKGLLLGSRGIIPSTGNFAPAIYQEVYKQCQNNNIKEAEELLEHTQELCDVYQKDMLLGESLAALKVILAHLDLCGPDVLPPIINSSEEEKNRIIENYKRTIRHES